MKKLYTLIAAALFATGAVAQNPSAYFMEGSTFRSQFNPAFAPLRGYVEVLAYKGSSVYDSRAMASLIDYLVDQAEQMELPIAYDLRQIERIKEDWGREFARRAAALEKGGN